MDHPQSRGATGALAVYCGVCKAESGEPCRRDERDSARRHQPHALRASAAASLERRPAGLIGGIRSDLGGARGY